MTKAEAVAILDKWSAQPLIRRLMPEIVRAVRLLIRRPAVSVGMSKVKAEWRKRD